MKLTENLYATTSFAKEKWEITVLEVPGWTEVIKTEPRYSTEESARGRLYNLKRKLKNLSHADALKVVKTLNDKAGPKPSGAMVSVHLRMPAALHEEYKELAEKAGMCVSEYYRAVLFGAEADDAQ